MTGMERAIEYATRVIGDLPGFNDAQVRRIAEDLAEAGLLAPAPLREEHTVRYTPTRGIPGGYDMTLEEYQVFMEKHGTRQRRWVTEWETP